MYANHRTLNLGAQALIPSDGHRAISKRAGSTVVQGTRSHPLDVAKPESIAAVTEATPLG
jgi:hypothetical protein